MTHISIPPNTSVAALVVIWMVVVMMTDHTD